MTMMKNILIYFDHPVLPTQGGTERTSFLLANRLHTGDPNLFSIPIASQKIMLCTLSGIQPFAPVPKIISIKNPLCYFWTPIRSISQCIAAS